MDRGTIGRGPDRRACKRDDSMRSGQLALPHGYGQDYPAADGARLSNGPRVNVLTESGNRDPIAGTPYHKHVRCGWNGWRQRRLRPVRSSRSRIHRASA